MGTQPILTTLSGDGKSARRASRAAILVTLLLIVPLMASIPPESVQESKKLSSQRSTEPDVAVTDMNVTTPSVMVGGTPYLAPGEHIISANIANMGGSTANGELHLKVNTVSVDSRVVSINPGQQAVHLLLWDATPGSGIDLEVVWEPDTPAGDSDSDNNALSMESVEVTSLEEASRIADSLPEEGSSVARALWAGAITVVNTGNQPVNVTAQLTLTPVIGGPTVSLTSTTEDLTPGSLSDPPEPKNISIGFDGTNLEGNYTLGGSLLVSGSTQSVVNIESRIVNFIALRATLIPANNRNVDPGSGTILNFILQNSGTVSDNFTVTQTNTSSPGNYWANTSHNMFTPAAPLFVSSGATQAIQVPVDVPSDAANGESVIVTISVQSLAAGYVIEGRTIVMAGGTYDSEIFQNHSHEDGEDIANITPGTPKHLEYTLKNTGTAPTQFEINVGATEAVPFWTIHSPITITDVVMPNETRAIPVTITTPELEMPLNPSWKVSSIEQVELVVQAIPLDGGIPSTNQTTLVIDSVVELDVQITGGANDVSVADVISGNTNRFVDFEVRIVHNLGSNSTLAQVSLAPTLDGGGSGKTFIGDNYLADSSTSEHTRWTATAVPSTMELQPGEVGYGYVAISFEDDHDFPYPAAGIFSYAFEASSDWGSFPGTISRNSSASVNFSIEELWSAELTPGSIATGDPGTSISSDLVLKNTGNDVANFTIGYVPIPDWDISLGSIAVNQLMSRTNLYPKGVDRAPDGDLFDITVTAIPPSDASAEKIHEIWVYANSTETGELLAFAPALIDLTKVISAELTPQNSTAVITKDDMAATSRVGQQTIIMQLNNSGNSNVTYDLNLHRFDTEVLVTFADDGTTLLNKSMTVAPGSQAIVRVYATVGSEARADINSRFELSVSHNGTELDRSGVVVQVAPDHAMTFVLGQDLQVAPGNILEIPITLINDGNLRETLNLTAEFGPSISNWNYSVNDSNFSLDPKERHSVLLTISVPKLDVNGSILEAYISHEVTIRAINITDPFPTWPSTKTVNGTVVTVPVSERVGIPAGTKKVSVEILPVFDVQLVEAPHRIALVPGIDRTVDYVLENRGNAQMDISVQWRTQDSDVEERFGVEAAVSSTLLSLDVGDRSSMVFTFSTKGGDHYKGEPGSFILTLTPQGVDIDPSIESTPIEIVRAQTDDEYLLSADAAGQYECDDVADYAPAEASRCRQIEIPWANVNAAGSTNTAERTYTLALNGKRDPYGSSADYPERLVSSIFYSTAEWGLNIDTNPGTGGGSMCQMTSEPNAQGVGASSATKENCDSLWDLDATTPYDLVPGGVHGGTIVIQVIVPEKTKLAPGDGWDIYLQIRNPEEGPTTLNSTDLIVKIRMTESTDPLIESVTFDGGGVEGKSTSIDVVVINAGNAIMPSGVEVQLECPTSRFASIVGMSNNVAVPPLEATGNFTASWSVTLNPIPWYAASVDLECIASLVIPPDIVEQGGIFGNLEDNDVSESSIEIASWSTPPAEFAGISLPSAAFAAIAILFLALSLLRQGLDDDQDRLHASAYVAAMGFGTLSLSGFSTLATILCALATISFSGLVAWLSSSELQAIHDDRKKSRIGTRALLENHDEEQKNTRKELRAIISCAPFAFMPFVLITPSLAIDLGVESLLSMVAFIVISPILVHLILRFLDRSYDTLYSQLAEIELRAIRIKKILGRAGKKPDQGGG
tara:strand:- start:35009 stop:40135 length:5127 start_codon:yes stop_codon:yes gene_type:complete